MTDAQVKLLEANLVLYKREKTRFNKLSYHYTKLVKETEAIIEEAKAAEA